jgi:undecaprenyl phosphate-alpha-L-ara4FN deformylase
MSIKKIAPLAIKVDVDTARGTKHGVPNLLKLFERLNIQATFLFSLGPDNTGRAIKRIFRPGFFSKVSRTPIISIYGLKTLLNGILWPGPHIAKNYEHVMRDAYRMKHEVGIHTYDHIFWQDNLHKLPEHRIRTEVSKCCEWFFKIFNFKAQTMGSAGWQANKFSLNAYDDVGFVYASDTRGTTPFFPKVKTKVFKTLQIPTTLPTLDELVGRPEFPFEFLHDHYLNLIAKNELNVLTIHAELEGMLYLDWFEEFLLNIQQHNIPITPLKNLAAKYLEDKRNIPVCELVQAEIDGRSGKLACQGNMAKKDIVKEVS